MKEQSQRLGIQPIPKLLMNLSVPAMIGMFVMALYNVIDTLFIARGVGILGVSGVSIGFPVMMIIMAIAAAVGIGGASVISRRLGENKQDEADQVFGNVLFTIVIVSSIGFIGAFTFLEPLLKLFGATENIMPYATDYLFPIMLGSVFFSFAFTTNNIIRSEGNSKFAMVTMIIPAVLNIILDPIFIFGLNMGVQGASIATVISQASVTIVVLNYFLKGKSSLTIKLASLKPQWLVIREVLTIGMPAFIRQVSGSGMMIAINLMLIKFGGEFEVGVFGIVQKLAMFTIMPMVGVLQGMQPIIGYNYGAKNYDRLKETVMLGMKVVTIISTGIFLLMMAFPEGLMNIFTGDNATIETGAFAIRIMFALAILIGAQVVSGGLYQALGMAKPALILSMARQVLFLIPLVLILPHFFGVTGVWLAFPLSDLMAFILSIIFLYKDRALFFKNKSSGRLVHPRQA
ncbi:putative efflux protein, MATE family [Halobacillus karajensis]|uniref:Multidrug export protein MepA n=1 Tax=Halobacillus karajensis TaxID=195088 RepID=A0A024P938_9BACI|nr:MATE family efflux transporter [Halobacillus karajensis]CDQ21521.1 Multidrug export protein MepA [Halobacillus karajensis]CDQ25455.1 Multidrug export protein MepA [Halobacillus karajensis]CDQ29014.1 Multidrug export protein MepA [Halobacillus karajensis]SEI09307.1 putative efflux protein, MATE family [Halobacillus karajensis]